MFERPIRSGWLRLALLAGLAMLLSIVAWRPMILSYPGTPGFDGRYFAYHWEIARSSWRYYHEWALWNPFDCHGTPMWDHPESTTGSPIVVIATLMGLESTYTTWAWHVLHAAAGFVGMWLLARDGLRLQRVSALAASAMWAFAVCHASQYAGGHSTFVSFYLAPLLLFLWRRAEFDPRFAIALGWTLAFMVYDGGTYPVPMCTAMLAAETFTRVYPWLRLLRVVKAGAVAASVGFTAAASRLLPLIDQFGAHKRNLSADVDHIAGLGALKAMFTLREPRWDYRLPGQQYVWNEYLTYVGWGGLAVVALGLVLAARRHAWVVVVGCVMFVLMLGEFAPWAPWTVLHAHLFPFTALRVPSRFSVLLMVCVSLWFGFAVEYVPSIIKRRGARITQAWSLIVLASAALVMGDVTNLGLRIIAGRFHGKPLFRYPPSSQFYYGGDSLASDWIDQPMQNRAALDCQSFEWAFRTNSGLWTGDVAPARPLDSAILVKSASRTHNTFVAEVVVRRPGTLLLNSAFDPGWQTNEGKVVEHSDLLAVTLDAKGPKQVRLRYWPQRLTAGIVLSIVSLCGSILYITVRTRRSRRRWPRASS
jgi:hypothetical protein